jgi:hypothetical protein
MPINTTNDTSNQATFFETINATEQSPYNATIGISDFTTKYRSICTAVVSAFDASLDAAISLSQCKTYKNPFESTFTTTELQTYCAAIKGTNWSTYHTPFITADRSADQQTIAATSLIS